MPVPDPVSSDPELPPRAEIVIIGGGIIGAASALELAERGLDVVLCEKGEIAAEQSSRNWGWCRQMSRDPREIPLIVKSLRLWRAMNERVEAETGFRECGILYLAQSADELDAKLKWYEQNARPYGLSSRPVSGAEAETLQPGARSSGRRPLHPGRRPRGAGEGRPGNGASRAAQGRENVHALRRSRHRDRRRPCRGRRDRARPHRLRHRRARRRSLVAPVPGQSRHRLSASRGGQFRDAHGVAGRGVERSCSAGKFSFRRRLDGGYTIAHRHMSVADIVPESFTQFFRFLPALRLDRQGLRLRLGRPFSLR